MKKGGRGVVRRFLEKLIPDQPGEGVGVGEACSRLKEQHQICRELQTVELARM